MASLWNLAFIGSRTRTVCNKTLSWIELEFGRSKLSRLTGVIVSKQKARTVLLETRLRSLNGNITQKRHFRSLGPIYSATASRSNGNFNVYVKTGDQLHAGTDAEVKIILHSESGNHTDPIKLDYLFRDDFERGQLDKFELTNLTNVDDVKKIELFREEANVSSDWFVDYIEIENAGSGKQYLFPIFRWIKPNRRYVIQLMDNCLPQFDPEPQHREEELLEKKSTYEVIMKVPGGPAQVSKAFYLHFSHYLAKTGSM